jgi:hypothetical protein
MSSSAPTDPACRFASPETLSSPEEPRLGTQDFLPFGSSTENTTSIDSLPPAPSRSQLRCVRNRPVANDRNALEQARPGLPPIWGISHRKRAQNAHSVLDPSRAAGTKPDHDVA